MSNDVTTEKQNAELSSDGSANGVSEYSQEYLQKGFVSLVADALTLFGASNDFVSLIRGCQIGEIDVSTIEELKFFNSNKAAELRQRLSIFTT